VFNDAAEIEVRVGATGIDALKGVSARRMTDESARDDTRYGTLVAPNLVAVNHDHYFNFRLDLDIDGPANTFNHDVYRTMALPATSARRSIYVVDRALAATERAAQLQTGHAPSRLRVINEGRANAVGNPVSYEVLAANHARLVIDRQDWPARRARFLEHDVWVTPYAADERHAAGEYMLGSKGDDGLAIWTAKDRDPQPGHRALAESRNASPDAGRGSPGDAGDVALVQAPAAQLLQSQSGHQSSARAYFANRARWVSTYALIAVKSFFISNA
jgi:primary-amine oxidase